MRRQRATYDKIGIVISLVLVLVPMRWYVRAVLVALVIGFLCDLVCQHRPVKEWPVEVKLPLCLFFLWAGLSVAWSPIRREYLDEYQPEKKTAAVEKSAVPTQVSTIEEQPQQAKPGKKLEELAKQLAQEREKVQPSLGIEFIHDSHTLVPQSDQRYQPKVTKFAKLRVANLRNTTIKNVRLVLTKLETNDVRWSLLPSSLNTLFIAPEQALIPESVDLNPGEDQYFDVLVECNGTVCPKGVLAVPHSSDGRRRYLTRIVNNVDVSPNELTVRASGNSVPTTTITFAISEAPGGELLLKVK